MPADLLLCRYPSTPPDLDEYCTDCYGRAGWKRAGEECPERLRVALDALEGAHTPDAILAALRANPGLAARVLWAMREAKVAGAWEQSKPGHWRRCPMSGPVVASVDAAIAVAPEARTWWHRVWVAPETIGPFTTPEAARADADRALREAGWLLVDDEP